MTMSVPLSSLLAIIKVVTDALCLIIHIYAMLIAHTKMCW